MTSIAGLDFGTSSVKLVVVSSDGPVVRAESTYDTAFGPAGEVEQHPDSWWRAACAVLAESGVAHRVDAIGVTGQMQDLIAVAGADALRPALLYSDTRAGLQHERLRARLSDWEVRTGNHQDASNVAAKIAWLADHEPDTLARAEHLLFGAPAYIAWRAGGDAVCDLLTASTTGLLDVGSRCWYGDALAAAGAVPERMPRLVGERPGDDLVGVVSEAAATDLGVRSGIPIVAAMGDAGSTTDGLVGSGAGDAYLYLGTTGWIAGITGGAPPPPSPIHALVMPGWEHRLRIGAVQSAGAAAAWARRTFLQGVEFAEVERTTAHRVDVLTTRPLCLPGIAGERTPVRDGDFRGAFVGVHEATDGVDFYLGVLTGVAMGLRHAADDMGIIQRRMPLVGGASRSAAWRRILADVFDAVIVTGDAADPGCHSAARAAAAACGFDVPLPPLLARGAAVTETAPSAAQAEYAAMLAVHRGLYDALGPSFRRLAARDRTDPRGVRPRTATA